MDLTKEVKAASFAVEEGYSILLVSGDIQPPLPRWVVVKTKDGIFDEDCTSSVWLGRAIALEGMSVSRSVQPDWSYDSTPILAFHLDWVQNWVGKLARQTSGVRSQRGRRRGFRVVDKLMDGMRYLRKRGEEGRSQAEEACGSFVERLRPTGSGAAGMQRLVCRERHSRSTAQGYPEEGASVVELGKPIDDAAMVRLVVRESRMGRAVHGMIEARVPFPD